MTQLLRPISSLVVSGSWGLVGAPTIHEALDEGLAGTDGNTSYTQGSSALGVLDLTFNDVIDPGGLRTGFSYTGRLRRTGVVFNPDNEPRIQVTGFKGADETPIFSGLWDLVLAGTVFTNFAISLTSLEATQLWPGPIRIRHELLQCGLANTVRFTTAEFALPDPNIVIAPAIFSFDLPPFDIGIGGGQGTDRGSIVAADAVAGCVAVAGAERGWINECP